MESELLKVLLDVQRRYNLPQIRYVIGRRKTCSQASYSPIREHKYMISQCTWWSRYGILAMIADLLHELVHIYFYSIGDYYEHHGPKFRKMEKQLLAEYGLKPLNYSKAYYKTLVVTDNGRIVYNLK